MLFLQARPLRGPHDCLMEGREMERNSCEVWPLFANLPGATLCVMRHIHVECQFATGTIVSVEQLFRTSSIFYQVKLWRGKLSLCGASEKQQLSLKTIYAKAKPGVIENGQKSKLRRKKNL